MAALKEEQNFFFMCFIVIALVWTNTWSTTKYIQVSIWNRTVTDLLSKDFSFHDHCSVFDSRYGYSDIINWKFRQIVYIYIES